LKPKLFLLPIDFHGTGFARHMAQVKTCYSDYASVLPSSPLQFQLQGLNLMFLLANSKIAEFHTELELIQVKKIHGFIAIFPHFTTVVQVDQWENPFVHFPIKLEQYLMEGSYQKVKYFDLMRLVDRVLRSLSIKLHRCFHRLETCLPRRIIFS
jgi:hypothetical protein